MRDKLLLAGLLLALGVALVPIFRPTSQSRPGQDLPWQITEEANGAITVFGLTLGESTLGEAIAKLGNRVELAIFRGRDGLLALEAYFRDTVLGGLNARVVLTLQLEQPVLQDWLSRLGTGKRLPDGSEQFPLDEGDAELAQELPVTSLTYAPRVELDEALIRDRFGEPGEQIRLPDGARHFLYPDKGLDLRLEPDGKALLQYLPPSEFERVRAPLRQAAQTANSNPVTTQP
ncbi:MAG TPA: hypothetical protein VNN09_10410 [Candidatus Competibacteraceae bacterium]|nr:hypothetical protein [Candidatus Competibacteraceae bacterium]